MRFRLIQRQRSNAKYTPRATTSEISTTCLNILRVGLSSPSGRPPTDHLLHLGYRRFPKILLAISWAWMKNRQQGRAIWQERQPCQNVGVHSNTNHLPRQTNRFSQKRDSHDTLSLEAKATPLRISTFVNLVRKFSKSYDRRTWLGARSPICWLSSSSVSSVSSARESRVDRRVYALTEEQQDELLCLENVSRSRNASVTGANRTRRARPGSSLVRFHVFRCDTPPTSDLKYVNFWRIILGRIEQGWVEVIRVIRGLGHGLDEAAVRAAQQIRYKPARRDGQPVEFPASVRIVFQLAY